MIIKSKAKLKKTIEEKSKNKSALIKKGVFDIIPPEHTFSIGQLVKKHTS